jgi:hypothetical protein
MRDGRHVTVEVTADGAGLVSHGGTALLAGVADKVGLTTGLSLRLAVLKARRRGHDPGRVGRDLAVMLADGGECVSDLGGVRDQESLLGPVAADSTAFRVVDRIASTPGSLDALRSAHATGRERFWDLHGAPERLTIDVDAALITTHSEKEHAAGTYKGGYGFHPLVAYADETREALAGVLRPGNAGANTAADLHRGPGLGARADPGRARRAHRDSGARGYGRRDARPHRLLPRGEPALLRQIRADRRGPRCDPPNPRERVGSALDQDGSERENGQVAEITDAVDLSAWPERSRVIVRRERPHPGAQLSFTDHDGYRFQAILTDQTDKNIAVIECCHRQHAHVEDRIRDDKDTGLAKFPFKEFKLNEVWLEIVMLAHDLIVWTQALLLDGELANAEPKRVRYHLLHVAGRLAFHGRQARLRIQHDWPWANQLVAAFQRLKALPAAAG